MTCHYPCLGSTSDWLRQISHAARPIRSTTKIWVVTDHQYGISSLVSQTSFRRETGGGIVKCQLFSQLKEITKEGIKIKRIINKTANFNPFTLRPSYDEMICHQILWCYHLNKPLWQNVSIVLLPWILLKEISTLCELFNLAIVRPFHEIKTNVVENAKS